ncbi:MAG: DNA polymerase III subunit delta [Candidatus Makaraimicrobium thalassicum]|nr:MAG: DNA polymerase III subunit delta [Candidatus Omnitrophota bacterium]
MNENYLIIGDDDYLRETEENRIKERFFPSGGGDLDHSVCSPDDIDTIMDSLGTIPFLAGKRVVLVREAQGLFERFADTILSYLEKPSETSVLILSTAGSFGKSKYYRRLSGLVKIVKADKPAPSTIKSWVRAFFKKEGIRISPEAVELIVELKGTDTFGIKAELDKLICFSGGEKIEAGHVEQLVGRSMKETVFKLVDAINAGDAGWAFEILNDLYDQKKHPHEIIGYLGWYMRIMQKIALLSGRGAGPEGIAAGLGYSPAYTRRLLGQAKKYSVGRIDRWVSLLLETDRDIKTGRKQPALALEMLLASFLQFHPGVELTALPIRRNPI